MKVFFKRFALLLLVAGWAAAYPSAGSLDVTGASDFVGAFTIAGPGQPTVAGYGGGFKGAINAAPNQHYIQMLFCVDFSNDVNIPAWNVGVNITPLAAGTQFQHDTRFGNVPSSGWRPVENYLPAGDPSLPANVQNTINGASALQRYQMATYLISNYTFFNGALPASDVVYGDSTNRGIQGAIWAILDPASDLYLPPQSLGESGDINHWLTQAANWLPTSNSAANQQLLNRFRIVSDARIAGANFPTQIGIQEFMTAQAVPEPSFYAVLAGCLAAMFWLGRRKRPASAIAAEK